MTLSSSISRFTGSSRFANKASKFYKYTTSSNTFNNIIIPDFRQNSLAFLLTKNSNKATVFSLSFPSFMLFHNNIYHNTIIIDYAKILSLSASSFPCPFLYEKFLQSNIYLLLQHPLYYRELYSINLTAPLPLIFLATFSVILLKYSFISSKSSFAIIKNNQ